MKMAGLCLISVLLAVSLSIGDCVPLEPGYVARIAARILNSYDFEGKQFSVAVNVPEVTKTPEELEKVILPADEDKMNKALDKGEVYKDINVVVAEPQGRKNQNDNTYTEHAEKQVLDNLGDLANTRQGDILVLYSWLSPCGDKCTNEGGNFNILDKIGELKNKRKSFAFVFYTVYDYIYKNGKKEDIPVADIKKTFLNLRKVINDDNIFRCYDLDPKKVHKLKCFKCFKDALPGGDPVAECVKQ